MMPTVQEIAAALLTAPHIANPYDVAEQWADFDAYRAAKAATGAPTVLERDVRRAAERCAAAEAELRGYLTRARREADEMLGHLETIGSRMECCTWGALDGRKNAARLHAEMRAARLVFRDAVVTWRDLADRIVATPDEAAVAAAKHAALKAARRENVVGAWMRLHRADIAARAAQHGIAATGKRKIAEALADAGVQP